MSEERSEAEEREYARQVCDWFRDSHGADLIGHGVFDRWSGERGQVLDILAPHGVLLGYVVRWPSGQVTNTTLGALEMRVDLGEGSEEARVSFEPIPRRTR